MTKTLSFMGTVVGTLALLGLMLWLTVQPLVSPIPSTPPLVDEARIKSHVQRLSQEMYPRSFDHAGKLNAAASYIHDEFAAAGARVSEQKVIVEESEYRNVIAKFGPEDGPLLVIGAHYDSHGDAIEGAKRSKGFSPDTHTPGADDNASGVAGILELARILGQFPPSRPVELVAFTLEEPPHFRTKHMGSVWHAQSLRARARPVQLMLSLEMIGFFSDDPASQSYPLPGMQMIYPEKGNFISVVGRLHESWEARRVKALMAGATDLPVQSVNSFAFIPGLDFSDHRSYWAEGYSALMITDTAFYRNRNYHGAGDTYDKLDYHRMAKVIQGVYAIVQGF